MSLVEMMEPQTALNRPMKALPVCPKLIMVIITTKPIPKAVPKLVSESSWYFLKYFAKERSLAKEMMAGLSERNVIRAPRAATPGRLKRGFIRGRRIRSRSFTTPNSDMSLESAPVSTVMPMR